MMNRRGVLAAAGVVGGTAGCLAVDPPRRGGGAGDRPSDGGSSVGPGIRSSSIATTGTDCGGPEDDRIYVFGRDDTIGIDGTLPAPTPCHAAVIDSVGVHTDKLSVTIDVASTLSGDQSCVECTGMVEYSIDIGLAAGISPDRIAVTHRSGGTHQQSLDGVDGRLAAVETIAQSCLEEREDESVAARVTTSGFRIEGTRSTPTPCYAATIRTVDRQDETVRFLVGIESTVDDEEACVECDGAIRYEIATRLDDPGSISEITIDHEGAGSFTVVPDENAG